MGKSTIKQEVIEPEQEREVDLEQEFKNLLERFKAGYEISQKLFLEEQDQRQTLAYYQRRNNALLEMLSKFESQSNLPTSIDDTRINKIIEQSSRLSKILTPLINFNHETKIDRLHYVDVFINETIPEQINDDLSGIEINPQSLESWIQHQKFDLISKNMKPIDIPATGIHSEYIGHDRPPPEEETTSKPAKKKRKAPSEAAKKKLKT